ncbi:EpsG family protein [uncultured Sphingomonas sp.]|uniref:EpsG family protein n=1 Tax=uncultured Sphingomonas sp. TaxID=158754 RepID=UPI0025E7720A|nr:EpsG family protein [uncultured Sphingomonas sp.]
MTPYYVTYAIFLACFVAGLLAKRLRLAAIAAFLPMFYLIAARGLVGVDSAYYLQLFDAIRYLGPTGANFEPGFALIVASLTNIFSDSFDILILLGCLTAGLMLLAALMLERQPILFLAIVIPFFLFDMTMNGLRYGLAFSIVSIGATGLVNNRRWLFVVCTILAASIQISSVVVAAGAWTLIEARIKTFAFVAAAGLVVVAVFGEYIGEKAAANTDLVALGGTAGLVPYVITLTILAAVSSEPELFKALKLPIIAIAVLQTAAFAMARYYYAGLRMEGVVLFLLYIVLAVRFARMNHSVPSRSLAVILMAAAIMSSILRLRNFSDEQGQNESPFAPYYFASEVIA